MGRHGDIFGEGAGATVITARYPEDLAVLAKIDFAAETVGAHTTRYGGIERDAIVHGKIRYIAAERGNGSGRFMSHHNRRNAAAGRTVITVNIAAADSASGHAHQNFVRCRRWHWAIGDFQMIVSREQKSFHGLVAYRPQTVRSTDWPHRLQKRRKSPDRGPFLAYIPRGRFV